MRSKLLLLNMESSSQSSDQAIVREFDERWVFFSESRLYQIKMLIFNVLLQICVKLSVNVQKVWSWQGVEFGSVEI